MAWATVQVNGSILANESRDKVETVVDTVRLPSWTQSTCPCCIKEEVLPLPIVRAIVHRKLWRIETLQEIHPSFTQRAQKEKPMIYRGPNKKTQYRTDKWKDDRLLILLRHFHLCFCLSLMQWDKKSLRRGISDNVSRSVTYSRYTSSSKLRDMNKRHVWVWDTHDWKTSAWEGLRTKWSAGHPEILAFHWHKLSWP